MLGTPTESLQNVIKIFGTYFFKSWQEETVVVVELEGFVPMFLIVFNELASLTPIGGLEDIQRNGWIKPAPASMIAIVLSEVSHTNTCQSWNCLAFKVWHFWAFLVYPELGYRDAFEYGLETSTDTGRGRKYSNRC